MIPPRRISPYRLMKIVRNRNRKTIDKLDKNFNYLILNKKNIAVYMIINKYKTSSTYGVYEAIIPTPLGKIVKEYVLENNLNNCDLLFPSSGKCKTYTHAGFSALVTKVFKDITGRNIGTTSLRHSIISHSRKQNPSTQDKEKLATAMGHSVKTADEIYNKINL
jgi:integrase